MNIELLIEILNWPGTISLIVAAVLVIMLSNNPHLESYAILRYSLLVTAYLCGLTRLLLVIITLTDKSIPSFQWSFWLAEIVALLYIMPYWHKTFKKYKKH